MVFTLVLARYLSERTEQEDASAQTGTGNTLTVCATGTVGQNGCQYMGGDGIQQAVDAAKSGDTVLLKAGTYRRTGYTSYSYNEDNPDRFSGAFLYIPGRSGRNLTLKGEGVVVLDGSTDKTVGRNGISIYEGTTTIENIKITGMHWTWCTGKNDPCGSAAIIVYRATANIINSTISQNGGDGIQFIESKGIISDNQLIQNGLQLQNVSPSTAIYTTSSSSVVISNNNIVENIGDGIVSSNRSESIITNNIVERNGRAGVVVGYMDKTRIQNNRINNNNEEGIYLLSSSTSIVRNNILVGNKGAGIHVSNYSYGTYPIILNNIITHTKKSDDSRYDGFGIMRGRWYDDTFTDDYNNYDSIAFNITFANAGEGTKCGKWEFCNSLHDDPKFVSESDFHLQPGSPGINAGDPNLKDSDGTRSDMGFYGGPNDCPGGDCSPNFIPFILNSSFEWGDYKSWWYGTGIDTSATQVHNCDQWGPCSDGKQYITLARKLDGDKTKADFSTHWIATGQNLSGRTIRVKFNAKAHSVSSVHQPPPSLEGLFIQREHPDGSGWLQQIPIPKTALTGSWKTYTFDLKIPASTDINTTRFRIVLKPEMNYTYNLGYYYDNIQAEVLAQIVPTTITPPPPTTIVPPPPTTVVPPTITPEPQPDSYSQVVLDTAGENFYYRSCNMDKSKADGVDFTKCNNFTYQDEVWTKHSVKSLKIQTGDLVISKLRSLDIDHRIGKYENYDLIRNILYYTALSQDGKTVYTRSCDILDNQDVASCTDWTFTETNKVVPTNLIAQSIENTTYFRDGKYRTLTRVTDSSTQYKFFSRECVTYPVETGTDSCSAWKENNRESSMDNYLGMDSYVFETSNGKKIKESYLTRFLGSIENYICAFNPSSTTPFEKCGSQTNSSSIEDLQIPTTYGSEASLEEAASTSTFVSDLNRLDLPAECRNIKLNSNYDDPYPGNRIQVQTMLNTRVPFNEGVFHTLHFFIPNQLEVPTDIGANPNPACTFAKTEAGDKYTCNLTGGALILNLKVKDNVTIGTPITVNSRVVSSGLTTDCPAYTFNVIQKPTTTPSPSITPTPLTITALTCRKVQELPSKLWTGEQVKYKVVLNDLAPGPDGTVVVRDDLSEKMELVSKPKYCELKTQEVQSAVLGISDVYTSRGSVLFSFILFSILSGGVTYYILYKNKDSITNSTLKEKPYLGGLVIAGVVLLIGGFYFLMTKEDVSPGDTPALISGSYLECKVPEGVKRIAYVMKIKGKKGDVITNTAEVQTGTNTKINTCTSDFKVTGPDVTSSNTPTPIQSPTPTPEYSPTPTPEVESSPTPTPEVESSPTPTPEVESSPTPTPEIDSSPTPTLADEASPTPTVEGEPSLTPTQPIVGFICGRADVNGDGKFGIFDFGGYQVGFASYYQKLCDDTEADHISYGACGGKDYDKRGKVDIVDFQSFAQRYNKDSCAL